MRFPDFIIAGARKCGTTWLHERLSSHPQIFFPPATKEVFFFDRYWDRGLSWYADYFRECPKSVICGEASPTYFAHEASIKRIQGVLPQVKLLFMFRNPVTRARSYYEHLVAKGDTRASFEDAIGQFPDIVNEGFYFRHLSRFIDAFGPDKIHVLLLEDFKGDGGLDETFRFLGTAGVVSLPRDTERVYARRAPRAHGLAKVATKISRSLHHIGLHSTVSAIKRFGAEHLVYGEKSAAVEMSPQIKNHLSGLFIEDARSLGRYLKRDLVEAWKLDDHSVNGTLETTER